MRFTVIKDFIKVMKSAGLYNESSFPAGTLYRFPNGSFIKFIGLDKEDVGKGLRSDIAYFNEINKCDKESYNQVASRAGRVIMDYNPDAEFFVDTDVITDKDCDFLQLTFEDNELLPERERTEILKYKERGYNSDGTIKNSYWANKWQVYGLGNIGNLQGSVFSNWDIVDSIPLGAELLAYGLDWGFSADPTALIKFCKFNGELYLEELIYSTGLTNSDIYNKMITLGIPLRVPIVADSAEPKSIEDLYRFGFTNIEAADKGPDSIRNSIDTLQQFKIHIVKTSFNAIREWRGYKWKVDKNGKSLNEPIDGNNHTIDPARYIALNKLRPADAWSIH
jgi:phage terminase large subunit